MRPFLHRGQAPAKGILHTEHRAPQRALTDSAGKPAGTWSDPRGYWTGQHTNSRRNQRRAAIKAAGGIRQYKRRAHAAQGHRNG